MKDAFIFLTRQPEKVQKLLLKFYDATVRAQQGFDFHICTYEDGMDQSVRQIKIKNQNLQHWTFGKESAFSLGYSRKVNQNDWALIPGNCDIPILAFFRLNKNYNRYWLVEDDVDYSGDIKTLIGDLSKNEADLQCTHLHRGWNEWTYNATLKGEGARQFNFSDTFLCFLPFFAISRRGLRVLDDAYSCGWAGHHEQTWPTILLEAGLSVRDIGGSGEFVISEDKDRHYYGIAAQSRNKTGSFTPTPPRLFTGRRPDTLWHPVKPFDQWFSGKLRRLKSIVSYYRGQLGI